nr:MAG TPA: hypothetical protein [Caudoviricetes sp.]
MENEMAFKFNKTQSQTNVPRVVMALEMSDNGNVSTLKYVVPRLSRTKVVAAQYDARRSVKGVGSAQLQAIVSNSLSGELLSNLEPIDGAPEVDKLVELIGDENLEAFMAELFRLATEDYATLRAEGVEVL